MNNSKRHTPSLSTLLLAISFVMAFSLTLQAHGPRYTHLATTAKIAQDTHSSWLIQDIVYGRHDEQFVQIDVPNPNLNFTTSTYWVKLKVTNGGEKPTLYYLEAARSVTNFIRLYEVRDHRAKPLYTTGDDLPFKSRPVVYRKFIFPIELGPLEEKELLFQVKSDGEVINLPLKLWNPANFNGYVQRENLTLGIYYGLLMLVCALFLFFAFVVRERIYAYYVSYVIFLFFMQASLDGLAYEYIWPNWPWMANHSILIFSGASVLTLMLYARSFLNICAMPRFYRRYYRVLITLVTLCLIGGFTSGKIYELTYPAINGLTLVALISILYGIGWVNKYREKVSLFFTLGFLTVLAGGIVFILTNFNIIYSDFLSHNAIKLGSAGEVIFLSLAMVNRYRDVQKEKDEAKQEAFENLEKLNEITSQQNVLLEKQVAERTAEIAEKSEQLEEKNKEIIDSITYAKRIQEAILPPDSLVKETLKESFILYLPKDIVAGDFYWYEQSDDDIYVAAADCTGHGVPGAMVSVVCHNALTRSVREFGLKKPSEILDNTAKIVDETFEKSQDDLKDGMDIALIRIRLNENVVEWAGANNPFWMIRNLETNGQLTYKSHIHDGSIESHSIEENIQVDGVGLFEIKADKQPIGKYPNRTNYTNHRIALMQGDTVYLFSDGYPDQFGGERGKKLKSKNFKKLLIEISELSMKEQHNKLKKDFHDWRGVHEQIDDVCVIGVKNV